MQQKDTEDALTNPSCSCLENQTAIYVNEMGVVNIRLASVAKFIVHTDPSYKASKFM